MASQTPLVVQPAIEESRCKPWLYLEHRFTAFDEEAGILRPLQRSGPVVWSPVGFCRASLCRLETFQPGDVD